MNEEEIRDQLALASVRLQGARTVEQAAVRNLRAWVITASSRGMTDKEIAEATGGAVSSITVHNWLTT